MQKTFLFVLCLVLSVLADITVLEYDFDNNDYGTLDSTPSDQAAGVSGLDFTISSAQNLGTQGWMCEADLCSDANIVSAGSSWNFGFTSTIPYTLTGISFFEGNNDCQYGFGPVCTSAAAFDVQYSTDSSFGSSTSVGTFTPPTGSFQTQAYSFSFSLSVAADTTYYWRIIATQNSAVSTAQFMFDSVLISGVAPTPEQICSGFSFSGDSGYFCSADQTGYYYCLTGPFAPLDSFNLCGAGTSCACAYGVECSNGGTESPCRDANSP